MTPNERELRLVDKVAEALAEYQGPRTSKLAFKAQAVEMLIRSGPLSDHKRSDFLPEDAFGDEDLW
jgi:hypothetical protein